jgi:hypothetical protein
MRGLARKEAAHELRIGVSGHGVGAERRLLGPRHRRRLHLVAVIGVAPDRTVERLELGSIL